MSEQTYELTNPELLQAIADFLTKKHQLVGTGKMHIDISSDKVVVTVTKND